MADTGHESAPLVDNKQQSKDHLEIDIPDSEPGPECCIYKVPMGLREVKESAYTPRFISIGPIHHGNRNLAKMERQKLRYMKKFCERISENMLERFRWFIIKNVKRICKCYDEFAIETEFQTADFVNMVLRDAVFIIELFLRTFEEKDDFLLNRRLSKNELTIDLLLLENQLPFFVLEDLYNLAFGSSDRDGPSFFHLTCVYMDIKVNLSHLMEIKHLTDFARSILVRNRSSNSVATIDKVYNATMLHEAGVDFKALQLQDINYLLDVRFDKGELQIPTFFEWLKAEAVFRNMMALEQCHYPKDAHVCSYIQLIYHLVDNDKDVDLLVKEGIFNDRMGSSAAVADMINTMMVGVAQVSNCYNEIRKDLNQHCDNYWNRTKATLRRVYFSNPWRGTGTVAAFMVVLFTLIQTILAILDRAMPTK